MFMRKKDVAIDLRGPFRTNSYVFIAGSSIP